MLGREVLELRRVRMGTLRLGELGPGQVRRLTPIEVQRLRELSEKPRPTSGLTEQLSLLQFRQRSPSIRSARPNKSRRGREP